MEFGVSNNLGVDPEFFIKNVKSGKALSAHRLVGDEKITNGHYRGPRAHGHATTAEVDRDGAALEIRNTLVTPCRDYLVPYLGQALQLTYKELTKKYGSKYEFNSGPVFELGDIRGPADIREFGCNPDFNAYTMQPQNPTLPKGERRRFTGGHIHISGPFTSTTSLKEQAAVAVLMDALIGLPLVAILGDTFGSGEAERREWYGKAGSFRFDARKKKLEYRTLSGRLLLHPTITTWALGVAKGINKYNLFGTNMPGNSFTDIVKGLNAVVDLNEVADTINNHNVVAAEALYGPIFNFFNARFMNNPTPYATSLEAMRQAMSGYGMIPFEPFIDVMVEANHNGVTFKDDMLFNWMLYDDYTIIDHKYIGIHEAMSGRYDENIFPQRPFLKNHVTNIYNAPVVAHHKAGDVKAAEKALKEARGW